MRPSLKIIKIILFGLFSEPTVFASLLCRHSAHLLLKLLVLNKLLMINFISFYESYFLLSRDNPSLINQFFSCAIMLSFVFLFSSIEVFIQIIYPLVKICFLGRLLLTIVQSILPLALWKVATTFLMLLVLGRC